MTIPFKLLLLNGELSLSGDDNFVHARVTRPSDGKSVLTSCAVHGFGGYEAAVAALLRDTANHVTQGAWQTLTLHGHEAEAAAQTVMAKRVRDLAIERVERLTKQVADLREINDKLTKRLQTAEKMSVTSIMQQLDRPFVGRAHDVIDEKAPADAAKWRERFENLRRRVKAAIDSVSR